MLYIYICITPDGLKMPGREGMALKDFCALPVAVTAQLSEVCRIEYRVILGLRVTPFRTPVYKKINRSHTHTPTEKNTPDTGTHIHTTRTTPQTPKRTHTIV